MPFLFLLLRNWQLVAIGFIVLAAGIWIGALKWQISGLESSLERANKRIADVTIERNEARAVADFNANELKKVTADYAAFRKTADRAISELQTTLATQRPKIIRIKTEIRNAPATDDGPVAPVLKRALDRLRDLGTPTAAGPNPSRAPADSGRTPRPVPGVPGRAASAVPG